MEVYKAHKPENKDGNANVISWVSDVTHRTKCMSSNVDDLLKDERACYKTLRCGAATNI